MNNIRPFIAQIVLIAFLFNGIMPGGVSFAQRAVDLPIPGKMVPLSLSFSPAVLKGIKIDPKNPLFFSFLIDPGEKHLRDTAKKEEYLNLIKYFLTALTTPDRDMWVNLSPYEGKRMIAQDFAQTEMGRDLLSQDYVLKQVTASLIYPEGSLGKQFWQKVYAQAQEKYGTTDIAVNTFNKVWIIPDKATVFEKGNVAMIMNNHLKVMLEQDYLALDKNDNAAKMGLDNRQEFKGMSTSTSQVVREIVLPVLEKEINTGANFALLRQIFNSACLAAWFKIRLKENILHKVYVDQEKVAGVELADQGDNQRIYQRYLQAYKRGVYNYIREEPSRVTGEIIPRQYFSGGAKIQYDPKDLAMTSDLDRAMVSLGDFNKFKGQLIQANVELKEAQAPDSKESPTDILKSKDDKTRAFLRLVQTEGGIYNASKAVIHEDMDPAYKKGKTNIVRLAKDFLKLFYKEYPNEPQPPDPEKILAFINDQQKLTSQDLTKLRKDTESSGKKSRISLKKINTVLLITALAIVSVAKIRTWYWENHRPIQEDQETKTLKVIATDLQKDTPQSDVDNLFAQDTIRYQALSAQEQEQLRGDYEKAKAAQVKAHQSFRGSVGVWRNRDGTAITAAQLLNNPDKAKEMRDSFSETGDAGREFNDAEAGLRQKLDNLPHSKMTPIPKGQKKSARINGGIDFDANYLQMNIQGDGAMTILVPQGYEWLLTRPIDGFSPSIIEIKSGTVQTLPFFKGIN